MIRLVYVVCKVLVGQNKMLSDMSHSLTGALRLTRGDSGITAGEDCIPSSFGVGSGVGDCMFMVVEYGTLCGNGEMSIESTSWHGEEDSAGGGVEAGTWALLACFGCLGTFIDVLLM